MGTTKTGEPTPLGEILKGEAARVAAAQLWTTLRGGSSIALDDYGGDPATTDLHTIGAELRNVATIVLHGEPSDQDQVVARLVRLADALEGREGSLGTAKLIEMLHERGMR